MTASLTFDLSPSWAVKATSMVYLMARPVMVPCASGTMRWMAATTASRLVWLFRENSLRTCGHAQRQVSMATEEGAGLGSGGGSSHLAGVLDYAHPGGVRAHVQRAQDVDHERPHGLELMRTDAAGAVDHEHQVHGPRGAPLLRACGGSRRARERRQRRAPVTRGGTDPLWAWLSP